MFSPFAIRLLLGSPKRSGMVSGTVYGVSTAGSIVGTLGTTFFLIPALGTRAITLCWARRACSRGWCCGAARACAGEPPRSLAVAGSLVLAA